MKICILGASGFIGSNLVYFLNNKGYEIKILTRYENLKFNKLNNIEKVLLDITDNKINIYKIIKDCQILINCVGEINDNKNMEFLNTKLVTKIIKSINSSSLKKKIHFIQISSCSVYKQNYFYKDTYININEEYEKFSTDLYGNSKLKADLEIIKESNNGKYNYTIIRPSSVISKNMKNQTLIKLIKLIRLKKFSYINNNKSIASYIHIDDLNNGILKIIVNNKSKNKIYNISSNCTYGELANYIIKEINISYKIFTFKSQLTIKIYSLLRTLLKKCFIKLPNIENLTNKNKVNSQKIIKELNFQFSKKLPEGIKELLK